MMTEITEKLDYSTILASSIHDMKNSLSLLLGNLDQVNQRCMSNNCESATRFSQLQYEGKRVNDHLVQLLATYRMDNSQYYLNATENDIDEFLEETMLEHKDMLAYRNISFELNSEAGICWFFDRDLIAGVITNIVNNLYIYTKDQMEIQVEITESFLAIHIKDNGDGYPAKMLCCTREHQGIDFNSGSTGLGLYFATRTAEMHNNKNNRGYIRISNRGINQGGCFSIYLP